jgi:hypothetical protein
MSILGNLGSNLGSLTGLSKSGAGQSGGSGKGGFITKQGPIRVAEYEGAKIAKLRKNFEKSVGDLNVDLHNKVTNETKTTVIKDRKVVDIAKRIIKKEAEQNRTYSSLLFRAKKFKKLDYRDEKGNLIEMKFKSSGREIEKRNKFLRAIAQTEKPGSTGLSPDQIRRNVKASNAVAQMSGMANGLGKGRSKEDIKNRFENTTSDYITKEKKIYKIGDKEYTTNDLRGDRSGNNSEQAHGFAGSGKGEAGIVAAGVGANKNASAKEEIHKSSGGGSAVVIQAFKDGAVSDVKPVQDEQYDIGGEFGVGGKVVNLSVFRNAKQDEVKTDNEEIRKPSVKNGEPNDTISLFQPYGQADDYNIKEVINQ